MCLNRARSAAERQNHLHVAGALEERGGMIIKWVACLTIKRTRRGWVSRGGLGVNEGQTELRKMLSEVRSPEKGTDGGLSE